MTQEEYISILFDDLGFTLAQRKDWLAIRGYPRYTDAMTIGQRSEIINKLKQIKEDNKE